MKSVLDIAIPIIMKSALYIAIPIIMESALYNYSNTNVKSVFYYSNTGLAT